MRKKQLTGMLVAASLILTVSVPGCQGAASKQAAEYKQQGIAQMEAGEYTDAVSSFQAALNEFKGRRLRPEQTDLNHYKALAQYKSGDLSGAIATCSSLIDQDGENWETYYLRGNYYLQDGRTEVALGDYRMADELNPDNMELLLHLYENLTAAGETQSAEMYLNKAMNLTPHTAEDYYNVGDLYYQTGSYEMAASNLRMAADDGYDEALLLLGRTMAAMGDSREATSAFETYMEKYPDDPAALNELGIVAISAEEYQKAAEYLERALESAEGDLANAIKKNLIAAYEYSGDFRKAYSVAREMAPKTDDEEIKREYEFLKTRVSYENQENPNDTSDENTVEGAVIEQE